MAQDQRYESWFNANGIAFRYLPEVRLSRIDKEASLRNQARLTEVLDEDLVLKYSIAMESGAQFPPLTLYDRGGRFILIGGNHRVAGAELAHRETFDAYEIVENDSYTIDWMTRLMNSAIEGKAPSQEEALRQAVYLVVKYGKSATEVAMHANLKPKHVELAARRERVVKRIEDLGVSTRKMASPIIDAGGQIPLDKPLAAALRLREETGMPTDLFKELVRNVNAAKQGEQAMLDAVAVFARDPRVKQARVESSSGRVRPSVQVRHGFTVRLTALLKFIGEEPTPESLQLTSQLYLEETKRTWRGLNTTMEEIFRRAGKALNGPARVPAPSAKRR